MALKNLVEYSLLSALRRKNLSREGYCDIVSSVSRTRRAVACTRKRFWGRIRSIAGPGPVVAACILIMSDLPLANAAAQATGSEKIEKETKEAVEATRQYTIEKKDAFERAFRAELRDIQVKIADLQNKTATASGEARVELQKAVKDLETKKNAARKTLDELHTATASAWNRLKDDMNLALERLRKSYKDSLSKLP